MDKLMSKEARVKNDPAAVEQPTPTKNKVRRDREPRGKLKVLTKGDKILFRALFEVLPHPSREELEDICENEFGGKYDYDKLRVKFWHERNNKAKGLKKYRNNPTAAQKSNDTTQSTTTTSSECRSEAEIKEMGHGLFAATESVDDSSDEELEEIDEEALAEEERVLAKYGLLEE